MGRIAGIVRESRIRIRHVTPLLESENDIGRDLRGLERESCGKYLIPEGKRGESEPIEIRRIADESGKSEASALDDSAFRELSRSVVHFFDSSDRREKSSRESRTGTGDIINGTR